MEKALALLGIFILIVSILPLGAFADSDPGFSNLVLNHSFSWYSDFPYVDTYGWIYNSYLQSATLVSNGVTSYPSPSTVPTLYQEGDFFEVSFDSDLLSTYQTPLWNVMIAYDSSTASSHYDIPLNSINCYLCDELAFYDFQTELSADGRRWRCISFISPSNYLSNTTIRIEYNGNGEPITVPITMICLRGYRFTPSGSLTEQEMVELQSNIVNALNTARLADLIGNLDPSDVDLTTLENTTSSILQKLATVPNIIQYIDQIETIDTNIFDAIDLFTVYYKSLFENVSLSTTTINYALYDDQLNPITVNNTRLENNIFYVVIPIDQNYDRSFLCFNYISQKNPVNVEYAVVTSEYTNINNLNSVIFNSSYFESYLRLYNTYEVCTYTSLPYINPEIQSIVFKLTYDIPFNVYYTPTWRYYRIGYKKFNQSWYDRIELYIKQLIGSNVSVPSDIQQTTDEINQNAQDVNNFQSSTQQSLDQNLQNVPVADYQIQATTGTQYMKAYSEALFNASNGFRIWFMLPLILFIIGMLIRWGIKK